MVRPARHLAGGVGMRRASCTLPMSSHLRGAGPRRIIAREEGRALVRCEGSRKHNPMSARTFVEILLVSSGLEVANQMQGLLERHGHHVRAAATVLEALSLLEARPADLLIAEYRQLEANADVVFRVLGRRQQSLLILPLAPSALVGAGAADVERWQAAVAQAQTLLAQHDGETLHVGDLVIDTATKRVTFRGQHISLPPIQFRLLAYLAQNRGRVVGAQELLKAVWGYEGDEGEARELVKVHVRQIRRRLGLEAQHPDYVQSVRGFGYLVSAPGGEA